MIFDDFKHFARKGVPEPLVFLRENWCSVHPMKCMGIYIKPCISREIIKSCEFPHFCKETMFLLGDLPQTAHIPEVARNSTNNKSKFGVLRRWGGESASFPHISMEFIKMQ